MCPKILIVEDQPDSREILRKVIEHLGYEVIEARSGEEGIEGALAENPDLIIMDIRLPGMSGIEATIALKQRSNTSRIPIIAHSGWKEEKDEALAAGMVEFLIKPVPSNVFREVLPRHLLSKEKKMASTK